MVTTIGRLRNRRGVMLLEIMAAVTVLAILFVSSAAVLQAHARNLQSLYEERVAWEAAAGCMESLEAEGFSGLREGSTALAVEAAGWENLEEARCTLVVARTPEGPRHVTVRAEWNGTRGRRQVEVRTMAGGGP